MTGSVGDRPEQLSEIAGAGLLTVPLTPRCKVNVTDPPLPDYRALLARYGQTHWWAAGMRRVTWAPIEPITGPVLDVGCGPGWLLRELPAGVFGVGVDLRPQLAGARPAVKAEAGRLPFPAAAFDLALALDLLEQRGVEPAPALAEIRRVLRPGGRLLVRVPAHPWLRGPHDDFWGGARRYRRAELAALVAGAGFIVRRLTYANGLLFLPEMAVRLAARAGLLGGDDLRPMPARLNRLLLLLLTAEARWLRHHDLPMGLSLVCLAVLKS